MFRRLIGVSALLQCALVWPQLTDVSEVYEGMDSLEPTCTSDYLAEDNVQISSPNPGQVIALSDNLVRDNSNQVSLRGNVHVNAGGYQVETDVLNLELRERIVDLPQNFVVKSSSVYLQASGGRFDARTQQAEFRQLLTQARDVAGQFSAEKLAGSARSLELQNMQYSSCLDTAYWRLRVASLRVDRQNNHASFKHLRLVVGQLPVFYWPYLRAPLDRNAFTSGFQLPVGDYHSRRGLYLGVPYSWTIARSIPLTITFGYLSKRGPQIDFELFEKPTEFKLSWLPRDRLHNGSVSRETFQLEQPGGSFDPGQRWHVTLRHQTERGPWSTQVKLDESSDVDYWRDFRSVRHGTGILASESKAEINYRTQSFRSWMLVEKFASTLVADDGFKRWPEIDVRFLPRWRGVLSESRLNHARYRRTFGVIEGQSAQELTRTHAEQALVFDRRYQALQLQAKIGYAKTWFDLDDKSIQQSVSRSLNTQSLLGKIHLARDLDVGGSNWHQTLEPTVFVLNRSSSATLALPKFDDTDLLHSTPRLFSDRIQSGLDRIPSRKSISVGATTDIWDVAEGENIATGAIGWIRHLDRDGPPKIARNQFGLEGQIRRGRWGVSLQQFHSGTKIQPVESNVVVAYISPSDFVFEIAYAKRPYGAIKQSVINVQKRLNQQWSLFAHHTRDMHKQQLIGSFAGVSFDNCCLNVKFMVRESVDVSRERSENQVEFDRGFSISVAFKGLFAAGSDIDKLLARKTFQDMF